MITNLFICLFTVSTLLRISARQQTYAVIVGISDYKALTSLSGDLRFADKDAQRVMTFLQSTAGGSVPVSHIRLLTNQQATQANISQALSIFRQAKAGDRVIFYFSGHGLPDRFIPYDVYSDNQQNTLTHYEVKTAFRGSKAATKLCIADACLSGGMTYQEASKRTMMHTLASSVDDDNNVAMLLASRSTQSAIESSSLSGGAFTYYMIKGLKGEADRNNDKLVTIKELHTYVAPRVRQLTKGGQTPVFYGRFSDDLALSHL